MAWQILHRVVDRGGEICEDRAGGLGRFAWILDGARSPGAPRFAAHGSDAAWLVETACAQLHRSAAHRDAMIDQVLDGLSADLPIAWGAPATDDPAGGPTCCLGLVHLSPGACGRWRVEAAVVGDVVILVGDGSQTRIWTDTRVEPFEARTIAAAARSSQSGIHVEPIVAAEILKNRSFINRSEGFAVVSPALPWRDQILRFQADCGPDVSIALLTDGFWRLVDPFEMTTPHTLLEGLSDGRVDDLLRDLRAAEIGDRDRSRWPRVKVHDDASVLVAVPDARFGHKA